MAGARGDLNLAVIGLGRMGKIYARAIAEMDGAHLFAVATDQLASESAFLSNLDVAHCFEEASHVFALGELDAVVIATPTATHRDLVLAAAAAGKAVFCEKPLALTLEDTQGMIDASAEANVPLQVGFMRRFDRDYLRARAAIDAGQIGRPVSFKSIGRDPFCPDPAYADPSQSGGLIIDMAIHDADLARWLMGADVVRVTTEGTDLVCGGLHAVGDLDNAVINLRFDDGAIGNIEVSRTAFYGYDVRTEVLGSKAAVRIGAGDTGPDVLLPAKSDAGGSYLVRRFGSAYRAQIESFVRCVRTRRPPACTGEDALAAFEICLAATYSARCGRPVSIERVRAGWTPGSEARAGA